MTAPMTDRDQLARLLRQWSENDDEREAGEDQLYTDDEWAAALATWLAGRGVRVGPQPGDGPVPTVTRYVVGFLFWRDDVLLIQKARPEWQRGRLNGVGGHVEPGETFAQAMVREFEEETGMTPGPWEHFATLVGDDSDPTRRAAGGTAFEVAFFRAEASDRWSETDGDEPTYWVKARELPDTVLPNLRWLVPLAFHAHRYDWPLLVTERAEYPLQEGR